MVVGSIGLVGLWSLINYSGLVVFSVYADCDPLSANYIEKIDQVSSDQVTDALIFTWALQYQRLQGI